MTSEDIVHNSEIIMKDFNALFEKLDKKLLLTQITAGFSLIEVKGEVVVDNTSLHSKYTELLSIMSRLFVNWDDIKGCFPMAHFVIHNELKGKINHNQYNIQNYIISRCDGTFWTNVLDDIERHELEDFKKKYTTLNK